MRFIANKTNVQICCSGNTTLGIEISKIFPPLVHKRMLLCKVVDKAKSFTSKFLIISPSTDTQDKTSTDFTRVTFKSVSNSISQKLSVGYQFHMK